MIVSLCSICENAAMSGESYRKCHKPDCMRKTSPASLYCCHSCATAAEAPAPYEIEPFRPGEHWIHVHSQGCEDRLAERGTVCPRCGGQMEYSGEHRLGGSMFTCRDCGTTVTP